MQKFIIFISLIFLQLSIISGIKAEENKLVVYTYESFISEWGPGPEVEKSFEKICNCNLEFVGLDSSIGILGRLKLEGLSSEADVILGLDTNLIHAAEKTGLLVEHKIDLSDIDIPVKWDHKIFLPFDWGHFAFIYDETKADFSPKSFEDLLTKEDLKIVIQDPRTSTPGLGLVYWVKSIYGESAGDYWKRLSSKIITVTKGWSESYGMFLEGEADMVLSYTTSPAYHIIAEGVEKYKAAIFDDGHYLQIEVAAITANSKNPELAKTFMKFILSDDFQKILPTTNWMFPVTNVEIPDMFNQIPLPSKVHLFPFETAEKYRSDWTNEWLRAMRN